MHNYCDEPIEKETTVKLSLVNNNLGITVNDITQFIKLSDDSSINIKGRLKTILISSNNQTLFSNVLGNNEGVLYLSINGITQIEGIDYVIVENDLIWQGNFDLNTSYSLQIYIIPTVDTPIDLNNTFPYTFPFMFSIVNLNNTLPYTFTFTLQ